MRGDARAVVFTAGLLVGCPAVAPDLPSNSSASAAASSSSGGTTTGEDVTTMGADTTAAAADTSSSTGAPIATDDGSTTTTSAGDTTTTGLPPLPNPYTPCPSGNDDECGPGYNCIPITSGGVQFATVCAPTACDSCPAAPTGTATPVCVADFSPEACALACRGATCPDGMNCYGSSAGTYCFWDD